MKIDEAAFERAFGSREASGDEHTIALWDHLHRNVAAYLAALPPDPASTPEPPEGKLRVRVCVALMEDGKVLATPVTDRIDAAIRDFTADCAPEVPQFRWIEADVTPWQPPAEETVQGWEVGE